MALDSLAHSGRHPLHRPASHITHREHAGQRCLERKDRARNLLGRDVAVGEDVPLIVEGGMALPPQCLYAG